MTELKRKIRQGNFQLQLGWTGMSLMKKWQLRKDLKESRNNIPGRGNDK